MDLFSLWEHLLSYVQEHNFQFYSMFQSQTFPYSYEKGVFTIMVNKPYLYQWMQNVYKSTITQVLSAETGTPVTVEILLNPNAGSPQPDPAPMPAAPAPDSVPAPVPAPKPAPAAAPEPEAPFPDAPAVRETPDPFGTPAPAPADEPLAPPIDLAKIQPRSVEETQLPSIQDRIREKKSAEGREISLFPSDRDAAPEPEKKKTSPHTFDNFVFGNCNRMAYEAALAVAKQVVADDYNRSFNPLFIYGPSGLGKTHLLHAIENYVYEHTKNKKVLLMPSEAFFNELILAIRDKKQEQFRQKYRTVDVLLLDDIQFFGNKESSLFELFNTFNVLFESQKNIVLTSDTTPENLSSMEDRLKSRFASGLVVQISPPDFEICCAILQSRAIQDHIDFPQDAVEYIARYINKNVRELEGAYNTVLANARLLRKTITLELTKDVLRDNPYITQTKELTMDVIIDTVCREYDVPRTKLLGRGRPQNIVIPRQIAMYLCRKELDEPFQSIANVFHKKDHTSVLQACKKIDKSLAEDSALKKSIDHLRELLKKP